uniref:Uncharacterized protein n=1 Tax=Strombidium rassoulzadegani TaxID=1082188 RepID=A0A7S3FUV6_9SPIT|eukprot:CAMPEP_0168613046 /NCGR_PEP_ID=MMETSP0449_2-20121227/3242_1 /TAXON_ID=1082188 /ORGANISM="Strombidium rassoulzadegani, Strain ras09" /LENGTH=234 /DNA_ID=CAMNT_0008653653 /DNA_START=18 /DNA_END=722 /DNA_ORIENTATION=+
MRGDIGQKQNFNTDGARTRSEVAADTTCFGINLLKAARYINLIAGTCLTVVSGMGIFNIFQDFNLFRNFGVMALNLFECLFGVIIMSSSFNLPCIKRNFFFLLTGIGKGVFNIFVGSLLFLNSGGAYTILGFGMIGAGGVFIFLSKFKNMTDDDLHRALSIYNDVSKKQMKQGAVNLAKNNKDVIAQAAYDNKDVIAQVAYDHKDTIASAAYDNKELIAETYIRQQNNQTPTGF